MGPSEIVRGASVSVLLQQSSCLSQRVLEQGGHAFSGYYQGGGMEVDHLTKTLLSGCELGVGVLATLPVRVHHGEGAPSEVRDVQDAAATGIVTYSDSSFSSET